MSTPISTTSKTTPVSDTAGPRQPETRQRARWTWSLTAKTAFLAVVFILVPIFLYLEFRRAYEESQELLLRSVRAEGRTISQSLLPLLETADNAALPELGRHLSRDDSFAHLTVSDQGPGVPVGQVERIFDRYYAERHAEASNEPAGSHFGIGLSIARRNVEAMGGTIAAENRAPHGLAVRIRLPLVPGRD
jgi:K+-sensing histidine kinase KdpD